MRRKVSDVASRTEGDPRSGAGGFTFIEMLVVIAITALFAAVLVPAMASSASDSVAAKCMSNLRQITVAWQIYSDENRDVFAYNPSGGPAPGWVYGEENYDNGTSPVGCDTNPAVLLNPQYAQIGPYVKSASVFHCPSDMSRAFGTRGAPRLRSLSMSQAIGLVAGSASGQGAWLPAGPPTFSGGPWQCYFKQSDLARPTPAMLWVIAEENPDSINDAALAFQMPVGANAQWIDWPSKLHMNKSNFSFADGHVEMHEWQNPQGLANVTYSELAAPAAIPNNRDVWWVGTRTSARIDGTPNGFPTGD